MKIAASDFQRLFNRRPATATVGISITAVSFMATFLQNFILLLTSRLFFVFDFIVGQSFSSDNVNFNWKQAAIGLLWSSLGLTSCYLALEPRNVARFFVITFAGVKLFAFLAFSQRVNLPLWQYLFTLIVAALPIILLLTPSSNRYYGRNR